MSDKRRYTLSVFTENAVGLTNRITIVFTRRKVNIESLTTSASEIENVHRFTVAFDATPDMAEKISRQLERQVDVIRCFCYEDQEIIYQEIALYKVSIAGLQQGNEVERIVRTNHARVLAAQPDFLVIEKTGHEYETQELYEQLRPYGLMQFARSGRIAISKQRQEVSILLSDPAQWEQLEA